MNLRNKIKINARDIYQKDFSVIVQDRASINRYGERLFILTEPSIKNPELANALATSILKDYGNVPVNATGKILGDIFLNLGTVISVVESWWTAGQNSRMYKIEEINHTISGDEFGDHTIDLGLTGYQRKRPFSPTSLSALALDQSVSLDWEEVLEGGIAGYNIYCNTILPANTLVGTTTTPPKVISGLTNAQTYFFAVAAYTTEGIIGDKSNPVEIEPSSGGPTHFSDITWQPQSLTISKVTLFTGYSKPQLKWMISQLPEYGANFVVYRADVSSSGPYQRIGTRAGRFAVNSVYSWYDQSSLGTGYHFYRISYINAGETAESFPSSFVCTTI